MGADAAEDSENGLHKERRLDETAVEKMLQVIEMGDVVAFEFKTRIVVVASLKNVLYILERVPEDQIARRFQKLRFPIVLEILVAIQQMKQAEID